MPQMIQDASPLPGREACISSLKNVVDALYVLGGKWKLPLILTLLHGPKRFNELRQEVDGISPKVLAAELKDLELNELLSRTVLPGSPQTIVYSATDYARSLRSVLKELSAWGGQHRERVRKSLRKAA